MISTRMMLFNKPKHRILTYFPAHIDLVGAEIEMINLENREYKMKQVLGTLKDEYDFYHY